MSFSSLLTRLSDMFGTAGQGIPFANRNEFVDGAFDSLGPTSIPIPSSGYIGSSMWLVNLGTGGAGNFNVFDARGAGLTALDSGPNNYVQIAHNTASSTSGYFGQRMERVGKLAGRSVTLQVKLWCAAGTVQIPQVFAIQNFGTGGSPSAAVTTTLNTTWNVTTNPKRFSVRVDIPSISGKTLGTGGNDFLWVGFYLPVGVTYKLNIAEAQNELCSPNSSSDLNGNGGAPTAFEYRGPQAELARVQRLYWNEVLPAIYGVAISAGAYSLPALPLPQVMRNTPATAITASSNVNCGALVLTADSARILRPSSSTVTAAGTFGAVTVSLTADARL